MEEFLKLLGIQGNSVVLIAAPICLAIIALASFFDALQKIFFFKKETVSYAKDKFSGINISRIGFIISAGLVISGGYFLFEISKLKGLFQFVSLPSEDGYLIANIKSGVIHHAKLCKQHLPDKKNQELDFSKIKNPHAHNYRNLNIYEVMGKQALSEKQFIEAARYFKKAIEETPERVHLYDHLAKLYGRQKKYRLIHELYSNGIKKVAANFDLNQSKKQHKKVANDLRVRLEKVRVKYGSMA